MSESGFGQTHCHPAEFYRSAGFYFGGVALWPPSEILYAVVWITGAFTLAISLPDYSILFEGSCPFPFQALARVGAHRYIPQSIGVPDPNASFGPELAGF